MTEMPVADLRVYSVVIDCADPRSLAVFWRRITGFEQGTTAIEWCSLHSADGRTRIGFQQVPEVKTVKNRVHLDLSSADEEAAATALEAVGATRLWVSEDPDDPFVVLADPEGNEFCVVRASAGPD
jgi:hypothetical protein